MKKALKGIELKHVPLWRIVLVGAIGLVAFVVILGFLGLSLRNIKSLEESVDVAMPSSDEGSIGRGGFAGAPSPMSPSIAPAPDYYGKTVGQDAENFEVSDYTARIRTARLDPICDAIAAWHGYAYVIFEASEHNSHACSFRFKVPHADVPGVIAALEDLKPIEFSRNTQTVQREVRDFVLEELVLTRQLEVIQDTLVEADEQYRELMRTASQSDDTESLARAVQSRIEQIERLSRESMAISAQLANIKKYKEDQLDQTNYAFFAVNVSDYNIVDTIAIRDAWVRHLQEFVLDLNDIFAGITIGMLGFLLRIVEIGFYLGVIVIVVRVAYQLFKKLWV